MAPRHKEDPHLQKDSASFYNEFYLSNLTHPASVLFAARIRREKPTPQSSH